MPKLIAYYSVAVDIDAQRRSILKFAEEGQYELIGEFFENANREERKSIELRRALAACKGNNAKLVIAAAFDHSLKKLRVIASILFSGVDCIAVTNRGFGWSIRISDIVAEYWR